MLKKTIIAGFALFVAVFAFQPVQEAQAKVKVYIGQGGYGPYYGRGYNPYYGGGYYPQPYYGPRYYDPQPRYYGDPYPRRRYNKPHRRGRVSCRRAKRIVRNRGFRRVRAADCRGRHFTFYAKKRGRRYAVEVRSRDGRIIRVIRRRR